MCRTTYLPRTLQHGSVKELFPKLHRVAGKAAVINIYCCTSNPNLALAMKQNRGSVHNRNRDVCLCETLPVVPVLGSRRSMGLLQLNLQLMEIVPWELGMTSNKPFYPTYLPLLFLPHGKRT